MSVTLLTAAAIAAAVAVGTKKAISLSGRVQNRERAAGVAPELSALLDAWELEGTHQVQIGGGPSWPYNGGVRRDAAAQAAAFAAGLSNAQQLSDTAHGRGGALDVWPAGFNPNRGFETQPGMEQLFKVFGQWAESKGFVWGGRWSTPDLPHVELRNWRSLPFPPGGA